MSSYVTIEDLQTLTIPAAAVAVLGDKDLMAALEVASDEADGYLASQYGLPLKKPYSAVLKQKVCDIALFRLLKKRGLNPSLQGADYTVAREAHDDAISWLRKVSRSEIKPAGIKDSSPTVDEGQIGFYTTTRRGW